jgi:enolase-phosphatase E1
MKVVLCDIEGTTTDISFVKNVLFPYARDNCRTFLTQRFDDPDVKEIVNDLHKLSVSDDSDDKNVFIDSIAAFVQRMISEDRKVKELKNLQGKIWKVGFENGSIRGR